MSLFTKTHFQNLLLAQPSQRLFISDTMPGAADSGVWAGIGLAASTIQILKLLALTHVAHEVRKGPKLILVAKLVIVCGNGRAESSQAAWISTLRRIELETDHAVEGISSNSIHKNDHASETRRPRRAVENVIHWRSDSGVSTVSVGRSRCSHPIDI